MTGMAEIFLLLVLIGVIVCLIISLRENRWVTAAFSFLAFVSYFLFFISLVVNPFLAEDLIKEVNLQQVSVKGQNTFRSQVLIVYKDGKLDKITLIPKTTTLEAGKTE